MNTEPTDRGAKRSAFRQPEMIVALSAIVLSLCGLSIALYEASIARQAERASVWPHVEVAVSVQGTEVEVWIRNTGVGPARIRTANVSRDGEIVTDWTALLNDLSVDSDNLRREYSLINGRVLGVDTETETVFAVDVRGDSTDPAATRPVAEAFFDGSIDVEICYCSVYDECWITRLQDIMNPTSADRDYAEDSEDADCSVVARSGI